MPRTSIDFGIDLGTTNSAIAVWDGTRPQVIKNNKNSDITPSAVFIDKNNQLRTGEAARQQREFYPEDAFTEFKLQMGSDTRYRFKQSGRVMSPEELSAEVLKALRGDVQKRLGEDLSAAVITVPAAFELPACEATKKAARLAGISQNALIIEPTAAAMAFATGKNLENHAKALFWLVYDFGGGTFDANVISIKDGHFNLEAHAGDNMLGGKLIDWEIVEKLLAPRAAREFELRDFTRANPKWSRAFAKLKYAAENAKISLSDEDVDQVTVEIEVLFTNETGTAVPFFCDLKRSEVARLAEPFIERSVHICQKAMDEAKLGYADVERVILVGGPTLSPYFRDFLQDKRRGLRVPLDFSVDPLTVVAQGAAIYAGTILREQGEAGGVPQPAGTYAFELNESYKPQGSDAEPLVGGRVVAPAGAEKSLAGFSIEFINADAEAAWRSGKRKLNPDGTFMGKLYAVKGRNSYTMELTDPSGRLIPIKPDQFTYTLTTVEPPAPVLMHSIGIRLASGKTETFLKKGTELPVRRSKDLKTSSELKKGQADTFVRVMVLEGEYEDADCNMPIGKLIITGDKVSRDVPAGSPLEVTLEIDKDRIVKTSAFFSVLDEEFAAELNLDLGRAKSELSDLKDEFQQARSRLSELRSEAENEPEAMKIIHEKIEREQMIENIQSALNAAAGGDRDSLDKAQKRLIDLRIALHEVEAELEWPRVAKEAEELIEQARQLPSQLSVPISRADQTRLNDLIQQLEDALRQRDRGLVQIQMGKLSQQIATILQNDPQFWVAAFEYARGEADNMKDRRRAETLIQEGYQAISSGNVEKLKDVVRQLFALLGRTAPQPTPGRGGGGDPRNR